MPGIKARVLAADSMGVRSVATVVEACGYTIGLDLGASIAPLRYGLPPHDLELKRLEHAGEVIRRWITDSHIIVVTHYHYDHYVKDEPHLYEGKNLLVKNINSDINMSQSRRGHKFLLNSGLMDKARVEMADGRRFKYSGGLEIEFSKPVWHGEPGTRLGKVLMVKVACEGESLIFTSDVQGPQDPEALGYLVEWSRERPSTVILVGPPTYFEGFKVSSQAIQAGLKGSLRVIQLVRPKTLILDHHLLRDLNYRDRISVHLEESRRMGVQLLTAAEYMGKPVEQLEALRKELWRRGS